MKCIRVETIGDFRIIEVPMKKPADDEVTIKVAVTGLCRTDLKLIRQGHRDLTLPRIPGEEVVGTICERGADVTGVNIGDLVYVYPGQWCDRCHLCDSGAENLCPEMRIMGFHRDGGFAEYVTVPVRSIITVPEGLNPDMAVFAEPLSCCLNALELGRVVSGQSVGIWGAGPAGTLMCRAARAIGAEVVSIEPDERRREHIYGYGSCPDGIFDVCIVAVGAKDAYEEALERLAPRGRLVVFSGLSPGNDIMEISFNRLHYLEQTIVGAYGCNFRHGRQALGYIAAGAIPVEDMISHRMSLYDLETALDYVQHRSGMKILLYPWRRSSIGMWTDASLKRFGNTIQKVMNGHDMTRQESYDMFRQIMLNEQPDLHQGAFLAALTAKGETPHEIAGAWQAVLDLDTNRLSMEFRVPLVENCGTGMDEMKTFNVSSAAAVVAAAGGVRIARHGSRALTSTCGTADLLEAIGINVECAVEDVGRSINTVGIGMFNGMSTSIHPRSLARILSLIRFGSTLNIAASLASPCKPTHGLRGVYSAAMVNPVCAVMKEIGYERALVVHGFDEREERGMDELSTIGRTVIRELKDDGSETTFSIVPEDVGLERSRYEAIAPMNTIKAESIRFLKIISGIGYPECCDIVCLNAGAVFYLVGSAEDIRHGVEISREIIESGRASAKLVEWIQAQADTAGHGRRKFMSLVKEARMGHIFDHILS